MKRPNKKYNGHKNWNHWNVSLWLFNDEPLYRTMVWAVRHCPTLDDAAHYINSMTDDKTPDGAPYTFTSIRAAITDWES